MPSHYPTRRAQNCPDGFEHQMPNGTWMCGRTHNNAPMFGDDLGFDDFNPDSIPSTGKINQGSSKIISGKRNIPQSGKIIK